MVGVQFFIIGRTVRRVVFAVVAFLSVKTAEKACFPPLLSKVGAGGDAKNQTWSHRVAGSCDVCITSGKNHNLTMSLRAMDDCLTVAGTRRTGVMGWVMNTWRYLSLSMDRNPLICPAGTFSPNGGEGGASARAVVSGGVPENNFFCSYCAEG